MATAPMMAEAPEAPAKVVCIEMASDGSFSVYPKREEPMDGMDSGAEGVNPPAQTAASIDEALDLARGMLEGPETEQMSVEKAFQGGFKGDSVKQSY